MGVELSLRILVRVRIVVAALATALFAFGGSTAALAQDQGHTKFDEHDRQVTTDWYNQHKNHAPAGLRGQDRLSADQESRVHEGATLDPDLRGKVHNAPSDLTHRSPSPPSGNRYVTFGGHVGLIDHSYQVKDVIHLHDSGDKR
jgi:Ni/Co efflux regulator RcnB